MLEEPRAFAPRQSIGFPAEPSGSRSGPDRTILALPTAASPASVPRAYHPLYFEDVGLALADFLVRRPNVKQSRGVSPLSSWRLRRVTEYIDENLGQEIHLANLSAVAGLSRMYFAAQFKAATGTAPHAYVLRRRMRLAQSLLLGRRSIQDVALAVGFKGAAHFVEVFHRLVGESPGRWRELIAECHSELFGRHPAEGGEDDDAAPRPGNLLRLQPTHESALSPRRLTKTLDYIDSNLARPLRLAELSALNGLSKMHFSTQFRKAIGLPPYAYVLHRRIRRGQQLLLETEDSTVNIALALGFTSQAHFTTAFKKIVGDTPARWRREQRQHGTSIAEARR